MAAPRGDWGGWNMSLHFSPTAIFLVRPNSRVRDLYQKCNMGEEIERRGKIRVSSSRVSPFRGSWQHPCGQSLTCY